MTSQTRSAVRNFTRRLINLVPVASLHAAAAKWSSLSQLDIGSDLSTLLPNPDLKPSLRDSEAEPVSTVWFGLVWLAFLVTRV
jgi:hypothetical protein